jgi:hypothetical protein
MHYIVRADVRVVVKLLHVPDDPVSFHVALLGVVSPIGSGGGAENICRQVDEIGGAGIPNIEEGLLPRSAGFQAGELVKGAPLAGRNFARPALHNWLGKRKLGVLDPIDPELVKRAKVSTVGQWPTKPSMKET